MSDQRHVIQRQVIELTIRDRAQARGVQDEVSRIYRQRLIPLIDRRCSEICPSDRLYRLERLDLDLGRLDVANLERDLVARFDAALQRELAAQVQRQEQASARHEHSPQVASQLELFAFFARTGRLPWWAEAARPGLLDENLAVLQRETPTAFARLLYGLVRDAGIRQRLTAHYSDEQLAALCGILAPAHRASIQRDWGALLEGLKRAAAQSSRPFSALRLFFWNIFLLISGATGMQSATPDEFYRAVLTRLAAGVGFPLAQFLDRVRQSLQSVQPAANRRLVQLVARLASGPETLPIGSPLPEWLAKAPDSDARWIQPWGEFWHSLPGALRIQLLEVIDTAPANLMSRERSAHILKALDEINTSSPETNLTALIQHLHEALRDEPVWQESLPPDKIALPRRKEQELDLSFSATDALPIGNSGLVILWPFLVNFFTRLNLLDPDRQFKDAPSHHRAAGLLQFVVSQHPAPPEYLLPLNKVLCGLGLETVFDFGPPVLEREADECANLLAAVIAQAPILNNMTPDGFRGSFLLRPGLLSMRDGLWLLRVERQSYDIVLDRFPWSWGWIKVPWLVDPIRVEW